MKVYISGSISDDPGYMQKFARAENILTALGYEVYNPARIAAAQGLTVFDPWELCMAAVIEYLYRSDILCKLPGWEASAGAKVERISAIQRQILVLKFEVFEKKFARTFPKFLQLSESCGKFGELSESSRNFPELLKGSTN